jgi:1-deoxy-D-xylulose-5-phosphate synthase
MAAYLGKLRTNSKYTGFKMNVEGALKALPYMGDELVRRIKTSKESIKSLFVPGMLFENMGITYIGPIDGHNIPLMLNAFEAAAQSQNPVLVHVITKKGKGYAPAEHDPSHFHGVEPFYCNTGENKNLKNVKSYTDIFSDTMMGIGESNPSVVAVTAAMADGTGLKKWAVSYPNRFFDVGIAEEHAVTFAAGMASQGMHPVVAIYSTFLQRAYDNIIHDVALQNLHVVLCIDRAGIVGNDGATHHGLLDLAYLRPIPNMQICAPRTAEDLRQMMELAEELDGPVAIRYPRGRTPINADHAIEQVAPVEYGKGVKLRDGKDVAVLTIGSIGNPMADAISSLEGRQEGFSYAHYDMRWLKPLDEDILHEVGRKYNTIVTAEDGVIAGGLGSAVLEWMADHGYTPRILRLGVNDQFVEHGSTKELYHMLKLDKEGLCESLLQVPEK